MPESEAGVPWFGVRCYALHGLPEEIRRGPDWLLVPQFVERSNPHQGITAFVTAGDMLRRLT
jgi:hypothetical protein